MDDERPDLGRAPAWAKHLHECLHEMKRQQQSDRHSSRNRDMILDATLGEIRDRLGKESDDGKSGTGLTGRVIRTEYRVLAYDRLKDRVIGGAMALTMAVAIIWWLTKDKLATVFGVSGS
jgi:hypothetical protein